MALRRPLGSGVAFSLLLTGCAGGSGGGGASRNPGIDPEPEAPKTELTSEPLVESASPGEAQATPGDLVEFVVTSGRMPDQVSYRWWVNGIPLPLAGSVFALKVQQGDPDLRRIVASVAGDGEEETRLVWDLKVSRQREDQPPAILSAFPAGPISLARGEKLGFQVIVLDPDPGDAVAATWFWDGKEQTVAEPGFRFDLDSSLKARGAHGLKVRLEDGQGHKSEHAWEITVASDRPLDRAP